jgi:hypothetical protein
METRTYYIDSGDGLLAFTYNDIISGLHNGTIGPETEVLVYDNLLRNKERIKAKELL